MPKNLAASAVRSIGRGGCFKSMAKELDLLQATARNYRHSSSVGAGQGKVLAATPQKQSNFNLTKQIPHAFPQPQGENVDKQQLQ